MIRGPRRPHHRNPRQAGGGIDSVVKGSQQAHYGFTLGALALKPSGFCTIGEYTAKWQGGIDRQPDLPSSQSSTSLKSGYNLFIHSGQMLWVKTASEYSWTYSS
ncbi:MAG: hypothetical protein PVH19_14815, partial [Planctomycetia bacterium]